MVSILFRFYIVMEILYSIFWNSQKNKIGYRTQGCYWFLLYWRQYDLAAIVQHWWAAYWCIAWSSSQLPYETAVRDNFGRYSICEQDHRSVIGQRDCCWFHWSLWQQILSKREFCPNEKNAPCSCLILYCIWSKLPQRHHNKLFSHKYAASGKIALTESQSQGCGQLGT